MTSVVDALKRNPIVYRLGRETKRTCALLSVEARQRNWKRSRIPVIARYLETTPQPKLHVGCGPMVMEGWLNTDLEPDVDRGVVYLDISEEMPLPDSSLHFVYSEHVIEHVSLETAQAHFEDCYRVLKTGGVLRVAMPDLQFLLDFFKGGELTAVQRDFLQDTVAKFHPSLATPTPTVLLNDFVRRWGHQFIYDRQLCSQLLMQAGFSRVDHCAVKESAHVELSGLEKHGSAITDAYNELQTMVIEATK